MDDAEYLRKLRTFKDARDRATRITEIISTERCKWNTEHHDLLESNLEAERNLAEAEKAFRDLVLADHIATSRTKYGLGVQIKVFETFTYDPVKALEWAKANMPIVVKQVLDTKTFNAFVGSTTINGIDFQVKKTPKALIPARIDLPDQEMNSPEAVERAAQAIRELDEPDEGGA